MGGIHSGRHRDVHRGAVEHYPAIDLRILRRAGLIAPGECTYDTLCWRNQASRALRVRIFVDLSDADDASLRIIGDDIDQRVAIECVPWGFGGMRCYFLCPIDGIRCEALYLVDGIFASRQAHGLTYASQSENELSRARRKARKLHRQVDGDVRYGRPRGRNRRRKMKQFKRAKMDALMMYRERLHNLVGDVPWPVNSENGCRLATR
jgi:hypothetical protein